MLFIPHHWFGEGPEAKQCLLNVYRYCGHEFTTQQRMDPTCSAFINIAFPTQGDAPPGKRSPRADPGELAARTSTASSGPRGQGAGPC